VLNAIWLFLALTALLWASVLGDPKAVADALFASAQSAVQLVIGLIGVMVFFLGLMRIAFDAGLRDAIARGLTPITRRLFPEIPAEHPAMGAMIMNMASNVLGMGNAATPFGLKAMSELAKLNRHSGSASNAMVLFLAINSSAITLLPPLGTIGVRAAADSVDPWAIWMPTLFATTCSTTAAVLAYFALGRLPIFAVRSDLPAESPAADTIPPTFEELEQPEPAAPSTSAQVEETTAWRRTLRRGIVLGALGLFLFGLGRDFLSNADQAGFGVALRQLLQVWTLPALLLGILLLGLGRGVKVYDAMIAGGREALDVAVRIVPYLVAILVAVAMFRASGALDFLVGLIDPWTGLLGVPAEVLPMALLRPLSASGAFGVMSEILTSHGPDSFIGLLTSTLMGSTETTFYVLAVYLGAAGVVDGRHALFACLAGDLAGFLGAVAACHYFFG
jgi:spore maturation protein SpmA/spore maturation protein SpmB